MALKAAEEGQGISIAPVALAQERLALGKLMIALEVVAKVSLYFTLTCATNWRNSPQILVFREWLEKELGSSSGLNRFDSVTAMSSE